MTGKQSLILFGCLTAVFALHSLVSISNNNLFRQIKAEFVRLTDLIEFKQSIYSLHKKEEYLDSCYKLVKRLRRSRPSANNSVSKSPFRKPPSHLLKAFTDNGTFPISKYVYSDDRRITPAITGEENFGDSVYVSLVTKNKFKELRTLAINEVPLAYKDVELKKLMKLFRPSINGRSFLVLGHHLLNGKDKFPYPWIEALAFNLGANIIHTVDYNIGVKHETKNLYGHFMYSYFDEIMREFSFEIFHNAASFLVIGQFGLGRYGEPLMPRGDIELVKFIHCMLKANGIFFLALPSNDDDSSHIEFNSNRFYGWSRLRKLLSGWDLIAQRPDSSGNHTIYVLKKV